MCGGVWRGGVRVSELGVMMGAKVSGWGEEGVRGWVSVRGGLRWSIREGDEQVRGLVVV